MYLYILPSGVNVGAAHISNETVWVGFNRQLFLLYGAQLARLFLAFAEAHHTCHINTSLINFSCQLHVITHLSFYVIHTCKQSSWST